MEGPRRVRPEGGHLRRRRHHALSAWRSARGSRGAARSGPRSVMDWPAGQWIVAAVGLAVIIYGANHIRRASPRSTPSTSTPRARAARPARRTCCSARSATSPRASRSPSSAACSSTAASPTTPKKSGGLDQALHKVLSSRSASVLLVVIAVGIVCYGLFCFARARHLASSDRRRPRQRRRSSATSSWSASVPAGSTPPSSSARAGLDVVGIEDRLVGGECPYYGCVPSKMMIAAAHVLADVRRVDRLRRHAPRSSPTGRAVAQRIRDEATDDWDDAVAVKRLEDNGARFVRGRGVLDGPGRVRVGDTTYAARKGVVLNTGTEPAAPPIEGLAGHAVLDQPRRRRADRAAGARSSCSAAGRSAASSRRCSRGTASR